jgi:hypothetical protein
MWFMTSRALRGALRTYLRARAHDEVALGTGSALPRCVPWRSRRSRAGGLGLLLGGLSAAPSLGAASSLAASSVAASARLLRAAFSAAGAGAPACATSSSRGARSARPSCRSSEAAGLELGLQLVDLQRLPAALRRRIDPCRASPHPHLVAARVAAEHPGGGELAELVADHRLGDEHGTCLRPSWTAIVWPTISGKIVEVRDQVFTMVLLPGLVHLLDPRHEAVLTHGPFLDERDIYRRPFLPRRRPRTM